MRYILFLLLTRVSENIRDILARDIYTYLILYYYLIKSQYSFRSLLINLLISLFERKKINYFNLID